MDSTRVLVPLPPGVTGTGTLGQLGLTEADDGPVAAWQIRPEALALAGAAPNLAAATSAVTGGFALWLDATQPGAGLCLAGVRIGGLGGDPLYDFMALADQLVGAWSGDLDPPDGVHRWTAGPVHREATEFPRSLVGFAGAAPPLGPGWAQTVRPETTWSAEFTVAERTGPLDADTVGAVARSLGTPAVGVELRGHDGPFGWLWCDWAGETTTGEAEGPVALLDLWEDFAAQVGERAGALAWR